MPLRLTFLAAAGAIGIVIGSAVSAQSMPGMNMPAPAKKAPASPKKKPQAKRPASAAAPSRASHARHAPAPATPAMDQMPMPMEHQTPPTPSPQPAPIDQSPMSDMPGMQHSNHAGTAMQMTGALGPYAMQRESSGTAWQPDTSEHAGLHVMSGDWMLMAHGTLNLVYDHQSGPRGADKAFAGGMLMGMASRPLGNGTLQLRAMVSPDPIMGKRGYPLLLAAGETANGTDTLVDRQHPHDFFMELSASVSQNVGSNSSLFVYAGLPGEPAFGPPAFMHRESILDSPEAPISHHWLDSTHITFGVVTAGVVVDRIKLEISRFNARMPDQHRWDIETGPLTSTSVRLSWNPTRTLALQGSWGHFDNPEPMAPGVDEKRWSASALWTNRIAPAWKLATTLAWGRKRSDGHNDDALAAEASLKHGGWTLFGRGEMTENRELGGMMDGPAYRVGKVSLGTVRDFAVADHFALGLGGLVAVDFVSDALAPSYGGHHPVGTMAFVRLKLD